MCGQDTRHPESDGQEPTSGQKVRSKTRRLLDYLETRVASEGELYVKSRFIAEDIELSAKEIGAQMSRLQQRETNVTVEKWSYTNGTTWRVTPR